VWFFKLYNQPSVATNFDAFVSRAAIGPIPGLYIFWAGGLVAAVFILLALFTLTLNDATGEVLEQTRVFERLGVQRFFRPVTREHKSGTGTWQRPHAHRDEFMT